MVYDCVECGIEVEPEESGTCPECGGSLTPGNDDLDWVTRLRVMGLEDVEDDDELGDSPRDRWLLEGADLPFSPLLMASQRTTTPLGRDPT